MGEDSVIDVETYLLSDGSSGYVLEHLDELVVRRWRVRWVCMDWSYSTAISLEEFRRRILAIRATICTTHLALSALFSTRSSHAVMRHSCQTADRVRDAAVYKRSASTGVAHLYETGARERARVGVRYSCAIGRIRREILTLIRCLYGPINMHNRTSNRLHHQFMRCSSTYPLASRRRTGRFYIHNTGSSPI